MPLKEKTETVQNESMMSAGMIILKYMDSNSSLQVNLTLHVLNKDWKKDIALLMVT